MAGRVRGRSSQGSDRVIQFTSTRLVGGWVGKKVSATDPAGSHTTGEHMPRILTTGLAALATTALALTLTTTSAEAAKPVKVKTKVSIDSFDVGETDVVFNGKVKARKSFCQKGRKVVLTQIDDNVKAGTDKTNKKGVWQVTFDQDVVGPGVFKATVQRKVVKKKGKKFVCKGVSVTSDIAAQA